MSRYVQTLKVFMQDYEGFDWDNGTVALFDAATSRSLLLSNDKVFYLHQSEYDWLGKEVWSFKHTDSVMMIVVK